MRRVIITALIAVLVGAGWGRSVSVVMAQANGSISGTAVEGPCGAEPADYDAASAAEQSPVGNQVLLLRNVETGEIVGTTTTDPTGGFSFTGLSPATLVIEVEGEGAVSTTIPLATGGSISDVPVIFADDCDPFFLLTPLGLALLGGLAGAATIGVIAAGDPAPADQLVGVTTASAAQ